MSNKIKSELSIQCPICLELITCDTLQKLKCGHCFHKKCIYKWMEKEEMYTHYNPSSNIPFEGICPMCRSKQEGIIFGKWDRCVCQLM